MTFISYAQNFEDVMLWRALKQVDNGYYVDIGAAWPDEHSVSKAFYERDWCGINVEPNPSFIDMLREKRSRDINLAMAVGDRCGKVIMNFFPNTGLSTANAAIAERHKMDGREIEKCEVQLTTLENIWETYIPQKQDVHFLKVDVEGLECAVIKGNNWKKNRPWIVVVEATRPMSQVESFGEWEPCLLNENYQFAYTDGLNRFYVAKEHTELAVLLKFPPNVFDEFILDSHREAISRASIAERKLIAMCASLSWRLTAPLRRFKSILDNIKNVIFS